MSEVEAIFCVSGLGLFITETKFQVNIFIEEVVFSGNIDDLLHPSVSVIDRRTTVTNVVFSNCTFKHNGVLKIHVARADTYYPTAPPELHVIKIEKCFFSQGADTGIDMLFFEKSLEKNYTFLGAIIDSCAFDDFRVQSHDVAILKVRHEVQKLHKRFETLVKVVVLDSFFQNSRVPTIQYKIDDIRNGPGLSLIVSNCTYRNNYSPNDYIVHIYSPRASADIWFYERGLALSNSPIRLDQAKFINTTFINNRLNQDSYKGIIGIEYVFVSFSDCLFSNSVGSALQANNSVISLLNANYFVNNSGKLGGGLSLINSRLHLNENSMTSFSNNAADYGGGLFAIRDYVESRMNDKWGNPLCVLSLKLYDLNKLRLTVYFSNNTAQISGDSVFCGPKLFSHCSVSPDCSVRKNKCDGNGFAFVRKRLTSLFRFASRSVFELTTFPNNLLICNTNGNDSNKAAVHTYPGANFNISFRTEGEYLPQTPVILTAKLCNNLGRSLCINDFQSEYPYGADQQLATYQCTNITYKVHSLQRKVYLKIRVSRLQEEKFSTVSFYNKRNISATVEINIRPCPLGYHILDEKPNCECDEYLLRLGIKCDINKGGKVLRPKGLWIGYQFSTFVASKYCPFDYCVPAEHYISLSLPDEQCKYSRSGNMCGQCGRNLSLVFGSSNCIECSNLYLLLIIPFALAGVALVVLLLKCNLTVSVGHINGLIFYANIVHVNKALLFQNEQPVYRILTTFIAWLNLDLGIETCFFEGMDTYSKVWLQFVFPVYLWVMVGLIVILAHYSSRAGRLIGSNSVSVLATLLLLSFAKLLRTIIAAVSFTFIEFEDDSPDVTVWLWDADVQYFSKKHIVLFFASVIFTMGYTIPDYTVFIFSLFPK